MLFKSNLVASALAWLKIKGGISIESKVKATQIESSSKPTSWY